MIAGLAQPFFLNAPVKIATDWFALEQRGVAVVIGSLFNAVGLAFGQVHSFISAVMSYDRVLHARRVG